jgi:hypothetical protein
MVFVAGEAVSMPEVGGSTQVSDDAALERVAAAFRDCLVAAGLAVEVVADPIGRQTLVMFQQGADHYLWVWPNGVAWNSDDFEDEASLNIIKGVWDAGQDYYFEAEGVDRTDLMRRCVESTGYDPGKVWATVPAAQTASGAEAQGVVEASNAWARRAREYGIQGVKDAVTPDASSADWPTVLLPVTITAEELEALLEACPPFDPDLPAYNEQAWQEWVESNPGDPWGWPSDLLYDPSIGFDYPGFDGRATAGHSPQPIPEDEVDMIVHLTDLEAIVRQAEKVARPDQWAA